MCRPFHALLATLSTVQTVTAVLRVPLRQQFRYEIKHSGNRDIISPLANSVQHPLQDNTLPWQPQEYDHRGGFRDPAVYRFGFNLSIGTPKQEIPVVLALESPDLIVQSAYCTADPCKLSAHMGFNSSKSPTFQYENIPLSKIVAEALWMGIDAKDNVAFEGFEFEDMRFVFVEWILPLTSINWYSHYNGLIGLTPHSVAWTTIKNSGLIDKAIMGLRFPSDPLDGMEIGKRNDGELIIGGIDPDFESSPFVEFPLADGERAAWWGIKAPGITFNNKTHGIHEDFPAGLAMLTSTLPAITLPRAWSDMILNQIKYNITGEIAEMPTFPCAMREQLGNLTLTLGEGDMIRNITLSAFDYTVPLNDIDGKMECVLTIMTRMDEMITLGWPFLRNYYTVLDEEEQRIRFTPKLALD